MKKQSIIVSKKYGMENCEVCWGYIGHELTAGMCKSCDNMCGNCCFRYFDEYDESEKKVVEKSLCKECYAAIEQKKCPEKN